MTSGRSKAVGYSYTGRIADDRRLSALLKQAQRAGVVTEYDLNISCEEWESALWFNGHPGPELRKLRRAVRELVERRPA